MGLREILEFVKIEHTLFSLPFVFIGAEIAGYTAPIQLVWILVAAIGARGLAMALNRIIDREIDAKNPRTAEEALGLWIYAIEYSLGLSGLFLMMLLVGAWQLNEVALAMSWLPVATFVAYPYMKRFTWGLSFLAWIMLRPGTCRGLVGNPRKCTGVGCDYRISLVPNCVLDMFGCHVLDCGIRSQLCIDGYRK